MQVEVLVDGRLHNYQYCLQCAEHNHDSWGRRAIERQGRLREWCQCSQVGSKLGGPAAKSAFVAKLATAAARVVIARAFLVRVPGVGFDQTGWRSTCPLVHPAP